MEHSKMDSLWSPNLNMQDYLKSNKYTTKEVRTLFSFRTRMAKFGENFKNGSLQVPCPLCHIQLDSQALAFQCPTVKKEVQIIGKYDDLFKDQIPKETLVNIINFRTKYLDERMIK